MRSERVEFQGGAGSALAGRLEWPAGKPRAFAVFAHCFTCSKDVAAASRISRALGRRGIAVLRFDFTGLGNSDGDFANTNFSTNVEDLIAAAGYLSEHFESPALLVGHSLGGAAVLAAAARIESVRAVATIGAPSDPAHVQHLFADRIEEIRARGEVEVTLAGRKFPISRQFVEDLTEQRLNETLKRLQPAVLILHSPIDEIVDVDHARRLYAMLEHPKSFVSLDDADHLLTRREDSEYVADVLSAWASRYVGGVPEAPKAKPGDDGVVTVTGSGAGFAQSITAGRHRFTGDEPLEVGGDDSGPSPYEFLLAALGTCTSMTLGMYARHKKIALDKVTVELEHERLKAEEHSEFETESGPVDRIRRRLKIEGDLDDAQRQRLAEIADRCPVHRSLTSETRIESELVD